MFKAGGKKEREIILREGGSVRHFKVGCTWFSLFRIWHKKFFSYQSKGAVVL